MRRIPLSRRSHIIGFLPLATGTAEHESALERDFVVLSSFMDPDAVIAAQPITITFQVGTLTRRYTPDYSVAWSDGKHEIVEVKYLSDLRANQERFKERFAAMEDWARARGATFRIATEREIRGCALENAKRLLPLRIAAFDPDIAQSVVSSCSPARGCHFRRCHDRHPGGPTVGARHAMVSARAGRALCGSVAAHYTRQHNKAAMREAPTAPELLSVKPPQWDRALRYLDVVRRLGESSTRTRSEVAAAAAELGCGVAYLYELLGRYRADPRLTSLLPHQRGPRPGGSLLSAEVDAVIDDAIHGVYLTRQQPRVSDLLTEIRRRCHASQLRPPGRWAVTARLSAKPSRVR